MPDRHGLRYEHSSCNYHHILFSNHVCISVKRCLRISDGLECILKVSRINRGRLRDCTIEDPSNEVHVRNDSHCFSLPTLFCSLGRVRYAYSSNSGVKASGIKTSQDLSRPLNDLLVFGR